MSPDQNDEAYRPLALIGVILLALCGFAVFFLSVLVAPLAILAIFYILFAASDRSKRSAPPQPVAGHDDDDAYLEERVNRERLEHEAALRRAAMERQDEERAAALRAAGPGGR